MQVKANMASPITEGTYFTRPFVNEYVDITHEDLEIILDQDFKTARYNITYHINSKKDSINIPLLFYAEGITGDDFNVFVDGEKVEIEDIPDEIKVPEGTQFDDFSYFFEPPTNTAYNDRSSVTVYEYERGGPSIYLSYMRYFETDISKGKHTINVSYSGTSWEDRGGWVKQYSFKYALSPARYWKSFGTLKIKLDARACNYPIELNIGPPDEGSTDSIAVWNKQGIPVNMLSIDYTPEIGALPSSLIAVSPLTVALLLTSIIFFLYIVLLYNQRKKKLKRKFFLIPVLGGIILPFVFFFSWGGTYELIDILIGNEAGRMHGYVYIIAYGFHLFFIISIGLSYLADYIIKKRLSK